VLLLTHFQLKLEYLLQARLVLYTFATAAWHLIVIELLRGGVALAWVAVCNQVAKMSPPELRATVIGVTNACSRALGMNEVQTLYIVHCRNITGVRITACTARIKNSLKHMYFPTRFSCFREQGSLY